MTIEYFIDAINLKDFGIYVSGSDGIVNRPKLKTLASMSWDDYHGESVDLQHKYLEPREITLSCFIKATSQSDFIARLFQFERLFDKSGTQRLMITGSIEKPLIYEVYCKESIEVTKEWNDLQMIGTFKLKLVEPEPMKRILHFERTENAATCSIILTTSKLVNIYWGDGTVDFDVSGNGLTVTHEYSANGNYYPLIAGSIDEISSFSTNATIVWPIL